MKKQLSIATCIISVAIIVIVVLCTFNALNNSKESSASDVITFPSTDALLEAMTSVDPDKHPALDSLDHFYAPVMPAEYELFQIHLSNSAIEFVYSPCNQQGTYNTEDFISACYYRENATEELMDLKETLMYSIPKDDGYYYNYNEKQIIFPIGKTFMSISVPANLNSYDNLKQLCFGKLYPESEQCVQTTPTAAKLSTIKTDVLVDYFSAFTVGATPKQTVIDTVGKCHDRCNYGTNGEIYYTYDRRTVEIFYSDDNLIERIFIKPTR